jgi:hypothetical protein
MNNFSEIELVNVSDIIRYIERLVIDIGKTDIEDYHRWCLNEDQRILINKILVEASESLSSSKDDKDKKLSNLLFAIADYIKG